MNETNNVPLAVSFANEYWGGSRGRLVVACAERSCGVVAVGACRAGAAAEAGCQPPNLIDRAGRGEPLYIHLSGCSFSCRMVIFPVKLPF
jgi:hypothetical protein